MDFLDGPPMSFRDAFAPLSKMAMDKLSMSVMGVPRHTESQRRREGLEHAHNIEKQNYQQIHQDCRARGVLFEDPLFAASDESLFRASANSGVQWKRPHEISHQPKFIVEGASRFDIMQGELGDCWLLAATANLTLNQRCLERVVPPHQTFDYDYCGIFFFRFWQFGEWVEVVVDDRLPTVNGKLKYMRSSTNDEFWSPLLEKAYAKLYGSYEALHGGMTTDAMIDFTGGVSEVIELRKAPANLLNIMHKSFDRGSLLACSIMGNPLRMEQKLTNGLVRGHAYSITKIAFCDINRPAMPGRVSLIRIRNPWGNEAEWNGPWSDKSREWRMVTEAERYNLGLTFESDGEFWMSYEDFKSNFTFLEITNVNLQALKERDAHGAVTHAWEVQKFTGSWIKGVSAGGCTNYSKSFWRNPKFILTLSEEDDGDFDHKCTTIVALMQRNRKSRHKFLHPIGFSIYPLSNPDDQNHLDQRFFKKAREIEGLSSYIDRRQVCNRFELPPGTYCIVPSTIKPNQEADFMLRIFTEKPNPVMESPEFLGFRNPHEQMPPNPHEFPATFDDQSHHNQHPPPPPQEDLYAMFAQSAGPDLELDWRELQSLLNGRFITEFPFEGFSKSACRSMVAIMDAGQTGKLGFDEFSHLFNTVTVWKNAFLIHDKDRSGLLDGFEFREALATSGYNLNPSIMFSLLTVYGNEAREISFDDFVLCLMRISRALHYFAERDLAKQNQSTFNFEEFINVALCM